MRLSNGCFLTVCAVKLVGKLQDGTVFVNKGHGDNEDDLFEFKTDEGIDLRSSPLDSIGSGFT